MHPWGRLLPVWPADQGPLLHSCQSPPLSLFVTLSNRLQASVAALQSANSLLQELQPFGCWPEQAGQHVTWPYAWHGGSSEMREACSPERHLAAASETATNTAH